MKHLKFKLRWTFLTICLLSVLSIQSQIVFTDLSDPDVCEGTKGDYWLTASSFQSTPGLPILHSNDLQHWSLEGYALDYLLPEEHYNTVRHGCGVWAPSMRLHDNTYYIYWGDPDYGVFMIKTNNPSGKWEAPVCVLSAKGVIDTCPLWDDDGRCYLVNAWANSRCGFNSVLTIRELSADGAHVIGNPVMVYDGQTDCSFFKAGKRESTPVNHTIEGPKLYKHNGYYYILAPAGGVKGGWQVALRSRNIYGPYESCTVFNHEGIHQGALIDGHFIAFQDRGVYGRILHLLDVSWKNDWPMMSLSKSDKPQPVDYSRIPMGAYQWHANYQDCFGFQTPSGTRVYSHVKSPAFKNMWEVGNLYLKKFEGETFRDTLHTTITAKMPGQESGFIIMGQDYLRLSTELDKDHFLLYSITCKDAEKGGAEEKKIITELPTRRYESGANPNYEVHLDFLIECQKGGICRLAYSTDGKRYTYLNGTFQASAGKWIGAKYGAFSITADTHSRGWIDIAR